MPEKDPQTIRKMFAAIAPRYDAANRLLSLRFDLQWRRHVDRRLSDTAGRFLDLAAGTGDLSVELARRGDRRIVSADFTYEMLLYGREKVGRSKSPVVQLAADALSLPFSSSRFDAVTVAFGVRNFADPALGLAEMFRVLKPGGVVGILEFSRPAKLINILYDVYFTRILPLLGGVVTGNRSAYEYLQRSVHAFPEGEEFAALMRAADFRNVTVERLMFGIASFYRGEKR